MMVAKAKSAGAKDAGAVRGKSVAAAPKKEPPKAAGGGAAKAVHEQKEDCPWEIDIPDHEARKNSATYNAARKALKAIVGEAGSAFLSQPPKGNAKAVWQDHHGGGLWLKDADGWFFVKNMAGMEWSQQFCADPAKVDQLRRNAARLYKAFPLSVPALVKAGFKDAQKVLDTEIKTADQIAVWCDSIFNASVPLYQNRHTATLQATSNKTYQAPQIQGGVHHYPTPITDIQLFKRDDFQLWVLDGENQIAAVVPVAPRGSGNGRTRVVHATAGTKLHKKLAAADKSGSSVELSASHSMSKQAFASQ
jgi:hypothetical protein